MVGNGIASGRGGESTCTRLIISACNITVTLSRVALQHCPFAFQLIQNHFVPVHFKNVFAVWYSHINHYLLFTIHRIVNRAAGNFILLHQYRYDMLASKILFEHLIPILPYPVVALLYHAATNTQPLGVADCYFENLARLFYVYFFKHYQP